MKKIYIIGAVVAVAVAALAVAGIRVADDRGGQPEPGQVVVSASATPPPPKLAPNSETDDYDPDLEEPVIKEDEPHTPQDFRRDSQEGIVPDFGPMPGGESVVRSGTASSGGP